MPRFCNAIVDYCRRRRADLRFTAFLLLSWIVVVAAALTCGESLLGLVLAAVRGLRSLVHAEV